MEVFELVRLFVNKTVVSKGLRRPLRSNDLCPNRTLNTLINNTVIIAMTENIVRICARATTHVTFIQPMPVIDIGRILDQLGQIL